MFGFSGEHLLVLLVILLIFGPKRLPDLGHSIGRTLKNFKDAMNGGDNHQMAPPASAQIPPQNASAAAPAQPASASVAAAASPVTEKQAEKV